MSTRTKRVRTPKMQPLRSPADSTPTPAVLHLKSQGGKGVEFPVSAEEASSNDTPRASTSTSANRHGLRIDLDALKSPSATPMAAARAEGTRIVSTPQPRPLKSSLKSRRPAVRGDLSVVTGLVPSKSEPATPTAGKSVHFDAQLERVKLFLAEQKPLAISREGSPTDDTSGTESDFPSAIYGSTKDEEVLTMRLTNMPAAPRPDADVALEDLSLATDGMSLIGRVRVRNIAFEKWVAVRFTFDRWQMTSEVTPSVHSRD